jgi:hypothetical protein
LVKLENSCLINAKPPETSGAAKEVPLAPRKVVPPCLDTVVIFPPGAAMQYVAAVPHLFECSAIFHLQGRNLH